MEPLLAKANELALAASELAGLRVPIELRQLLRSMNAYYTHHRKARGLLDQDDIKTGWKPVCCSSRRFWNRASGLSQSTPCTNSA